MLSSAIAMRLKPGLLVRQEPVGRRYALYDLSSDLTALLTLDEPEGEELCPADLDSNDRFWKGGSLRLGLYHTAQAIRRHVDGCEANLEINYLCHYGCRHCFQSLQPTGHPAATPTMPEVLAAADRLLAGGAREISITGGDIFLHPGIWELLDHLHHRAPEVTLRLLVNAGGLNLDDPATRDRLRGLAGRRVLVKSDLFGHSPELHDAFTRVPGSLDRLVRLFDFLRATGVPCLATAALTRDNFATRFELINIAFNLTDDAFTVATIIYPSGQRSADQLDSLRLTAEQYAELMEERFFVPLTAEYHGFEPRCAGDCQFAVVSATGTAWGCSFLEPPDAGERSRSLPLVEAVADWRAGAVRHEYAECPTCSARGTCRRCPSFMAAGQMGDSYCPFARLSHLLIGERMRFALDRGFVFVHPEDADRLQAIKEVCDVV